MRKILGLVLLAFILAMPMAIAYQKDLPVTNVYDPVKKNNRDITQYSYEELAFFMSTFPSFRRWNDMDDVCETIKILHKKTPSECSGYSIVLPKIANPSTARAYAKIEIVPRPIIEPFVVYRPPVTVITDPIFYPWAPVNRAPGPYGPWW